MCFHSSESWNIESEIQDAPTTYVVDLAESNMASQMVMVNVKIPSDLASDV